MKKRKIWKIIFIIPAIIVSIVAVVMILPSKIRETFARFNAR